MNTPAGKSGCPHHLGRRPSRWGGSRSGATNYRSTSTSTSDDRYGGRRQDLVELSTAAGTRRSYHARPFVIVPEITLTVGGVAQPAYPAPLGQVEDAAITGVRQQILGEAHAWSYPADRLIVLWECYLFDQYRQAVEPREDAALLAFWQGFERSLVERTPEAERLITTWEDDYRHDAWQMFLTAQGYIPVQSGLFIKSLW